MNQPKHAESIEQIAQRHVVAETALAYLGAAFDPCNPRCEKSRLTQQAASVIRVMEPELAERIANETGFNRAPSISDGQYIIDFVNR